MVVRWHSAFLLGRPGLNPGSDFGFFQFRIAVNLFSLHVRRFLKTCNRTVHTLPSSFLPGIIIYHCENCPRSHGLVVRVVACEVRRPGFDSCSDLMFFLLKTVMYSNQLSEANVFDYKQYVKKTIFDRLKK